VIAVLDTGRGGINLKRATSRGCLVPRVSDRPPERDGDAAARRLAERVLVQRVLAGEDAAEREFYEAYVDLVYQLAYRMTHDNTLAQEFTQDTFMRAFSRLSQFRGDAAIGTWLRQVALSVICNGLQLVRRRRASELSLETFVDTGDSGVTPALTSAEASATGDIVLRDRLMSALATLPVALRLVVLLHDVEGYHHHEIAKVLHITISNSKVRLFRARAALRPMLASVAAEWGA
jgi:RNA polymerase sigma-70 factor (ECF subfamily)